jgi:hypothetical protein
MFIDFTGRAPKVRDGQATLTMPFPNDSVNWPFILPRRDFGKWVMPLFEGGKEADGVYVDAVSTWTTPKEVVEALSKNANREVKFNPVSGEAFTQIMKGVSGDVVGVELSETMQLIGGWNYFGKDAYGKREEMKKWLLPGADLLSYEQWAQENGPFTYE